MPAFAPRFSITHAITAGLTAIERARGFLEAATLSEAWLERMSREALLHRKPSTRAAAPTPAAGGHGACAARAVGSDLTPRATELSDMTTLHRWRPGRIFVIWLQALILAACSGSGPPGESKAPEIREVTDQDVVLRWRGIAYGFETTFAEYRVALDGRFSVRHDVSTYLLRASGRVERSVPDLLAELVALGALEVDPATVLQQIHERPDQRVGGTHAPTFEYVITADGLTNRFELTNIGFWAEALPAADKVQQAAAVAARIDEFILVDCQPWQSLRADGEPEQESSRVDPGPPITEPRSTRPHEHDG